WRADRALLGDGRILKASRTPNPCRPSGPRGIALQEPGPPTRRVGREGGGGIVVRPEPPLEGAGAVPPGVQKTPTRGAGAAGVAAIRSHPALFKDRKVGCVLCGGNIDLQLLVSVLHRSLARRGRLVRLTVTTLDAAGQLADVASIIAKHGGNIVEVWH